MYHVCCLYRRCCRYVLSNVAGPGISVWPGAFVLFALHRSIALPCETPYCHPAREPEQGSPGIFYSDFKTTLKQKLETEGICIMKNVFKKAGAAVLALTLTAALAGCGSSTSSAVADSTAASAAAATASAEENELEKVKAAGKLVIGVEGTYPPFTYHDESGELTGLDVELGKALAEQLGVEVEFQEAAWDSLLIGIDTGRFDTVINSVSITEERAEKYDFSDPYYYEARRVVVRADDDSIQGPDDLNGKKIATNTTNAFIPWYEGQGAEVVGIDTSAEAIDMLLSGRVDFVGTSVPVLNAYLDEHPDAKDKVKEAFVIPDSEDVVAIPVRKGETEFLDAINTALANLRADGTLKAISEKYLGGDFTSSAYSD